MNIEILKSAYSGILPEEHLDEMISKNKRKTKEHIRLLLDCALRDLNNVPEALRNIEEPIYAEIIEMFVEKLSQIQEKL